MVKKKKKHLFQTGSGDNKTLHGNWKIVTCSGDRDITRWNVTTQLYILEGFMFDIHDVHVNNGIGTTGVTLFKN